MGWHYFVSFSICKKYMLAFYSETSSLVPRVCLSAQLSSSQCLGSKTSQSLLDPFRSYFISHRKFCLSWQHVWLKTTCLNMLQMNITELWALGPAKPTIQIWFSTLVSHTSFFSFTAGQGIISYYSSVVHSRHNTYF